MTEFNLQKYIENPTRKVCTRSGHNVRIICTDQRGDMPIVALVEFETLDGVHIFYPDGKEESRKEYDLFFADEEEELTEFDYAVLSIISDHNSHTDSIEAFAKRSSKKLLDLARKEILKDLPKWKRAKEYLEFDKHVAILTTNRVVLDTDVDGEEHYIELNDLLKLPKEE